MRRMETKKKIKTDDGGGSKLLVTLLVSFRMFADINDGGVSSYNNIDDNDVDSISKD